MTTTPKAMLDHDFLSMREGLVLRCPQCHGKAGSIARTATDETEKLICESCGLALESRRGIWNGLSPDREARFEKFVSEYQSIREAEGRGGDDSDFYLSLPYEDTSGRNESQWLIRRQSYACLMKEILRPIARLLRRGMDVLDMGAGNCWLSYRLALEGHRPTALDLLTNDRDGLGAARHFRTRVPGLFPRFRAEFDSLPFADAQFDAVIFNASFHYSEDYCWTLAEALRCLRRAGWIVICDTAWYKHERSGQQMIDERQRDFTSRYGTRADSLQSLEFLTDSRLDELERRFSFRWQRFEPHYGIGWRMRPFLAKLQGRREPSRFRIYVAEAGQ